MPQPTPFTIAIEEEVLDQINAKVAAYPWDLMPDSEGWEQGANKAFLQELCAYWVGAFDWRAAEMRLNAFSHFTVDIEGRRQHFIHEKGSGDNPTPLVITHGWPGSVAEFLEVIEPLAHPERFGGDVADAFDVIAPSLPGFGFSQASTVPWGPRRMAEDIAFLATDVLGYDRYIAQGGDWGSAIATYLGYDHHGGLDSKRGCAGVHLNCHIMRHLHGCQTDEEKAWEAQFNADQIMLEGYRTIQATKPQSLGYGMMDSPVGIAAWIIEKFHDWSDTSETPFEELYSKDELLTNIMIYLVTNSFTTASWIYFGRREEGGRILPPEGPKDNPRRIEAPTAAAVFPKEMLRWPPRSYVERLYNVQQWTEMPAGGHFAAMEQPKLLIDDIRLFARRLRQGGAL